MTSVAAALVAAASLWSFAAADAMAQAPGRDTPMKVSTPPPGAGSPQGAPGDSSGAGDGTAEASTSYAPVLKVTGVEVMRSTRPPELDIVRVRGVTSTGAWESPELVPLTRGPAADGVLELLFVARAPGEGLAPSGYGPVEAIFVVEPGHPYKGIRVRGATNSLTLRSLPGYVETTAPTGDCNDCVGKLFVARGAAAPAGVPAGSTIREEDLPPTLRVIRANEGVAKLDVDPNRLTLVLGDDGRITFAIWD